MSKSIHTSFPVASTWQVGAGGQKSVCLLCRVVFQIPLQRLVANLLRTYRRHLDTKIVCSVANKSVKSPQQVGNFPLHREVTGKSEMDFGHHQMADDGHGWQQPEASQS